MSKAITHTVFPRAAALTAWHFMHGRELPGWLLDYRAGWFSKRKVTVECNPEIGFTGHCLYVPNGNFGGRWIPEGHWVLTDGHTIWSMAPGEFRHRYQIAGGMSRLLRGRGRE
jgi:hypothetical protein